MNNSWLTTALLGWALAATALAAWHAAQRRRTRPAHLALALDGAATATLPLDSVVYW